MLAPWRHCLHYGKVYWDVTTRLLLAWNQNKHITYYIFHILLPKSILVFFTFAPTLLDDTYFIIAQF